MDSKSLIEARLTSAALAKIQDIREEIWNVHERLLNLEINTEFDGLLHTLAKIERVEETMRSQDFQYSQQYSDMVNEHVKISNIIERLLDKSRNCWE